MVRIMKELNLVYIGRLAFPNGYATTKRRRYMIDYFNENGINSHVLSTRNKERLIFNNQLCGKYKNTDYIDISDKFKWYSLFIYYQIGFKMLKKWFSSECKNIIIFPTILNVEDVPFFIYAKKIGYNIIFDKVETSYASEGTNNSWKRNIYIKCCELLSQYAYKRSSAFLVISELLRIENKKLYPNIPILLLPNSTPILNSPLKDKIDNPVSILYTGTFAIKDGVHFLIEGVKKAYNDGVECKLILLGKGKDEDMAFLENIKELSYIEYKGFVSDELLLQYMTECNILAMTRTKSKFANYGFPFKLSEYLSTGNIVVATNVGDIPVYLTNNKDAYIIESENSDAIAAIIKYIVNNPIQSLQVGYNGKQTMLKYFSIDNVGNKLVDFLNAI